MAARMLGRDPAVQVQVWGEPASPGYGEYLQTLAEGLEVTFHGRYQPSDLQHAHLDAAVFPSVCAETYSFAVD